MQLFIIVYGVVDNIKKRPFGNIAHLTYRLIVMRVSTYLHLESEKKTHQKYDLKYYLPLQRNTFFPFSAIFFYKWHL